LLNQFRKCGPTKNQICKCGPTNRQNMFVESVS
jgi:hypothetical protein